MKNDFLEYSGLYDSDHIAHYAKGSTAKDHKYIKKINGRYYYATKSDLEKVQTKSNNSSTKQAERTRLADKIEKNRNDIDKFTDEVSDKKNKYDNSVIKVFAKKSYEDAAKKLDRKQSEYESNLKDFRNNVVTSYNDLKYMNDRSLKKQVDDKVDEVKGKIDDVKNTISDLKESAKYNIYVNSGAQDRDILNEIKDRENELYEYNKDGNFTVHTPSKTYTNLSDHDADWEKETLDRYNKTVLGKLDNAKKKVDSTVNKTKTLAKYDTLKAKKKVKDATEDISDKFENIYGILKRKVKKRNK